MLQGDMYKHYKGGVYQFHQIALPLDEKVIDKVEFVMDVWNADTGEKTSSIYVDKNTNVYFVNEEFPHVLYQSEETTLFWVRRVNEFFDFKLKNDVWVKRFTQFNK